MIQEFELSDAQKYFKNLIYFAVQNHALIKIRDDEGKTIYLISGEDSTRTMETFNFLKNPKNAEHLLGSLNDKNGIKFDSVEALKNEIGINIPT